MGAPDPGACAVVLDEGGGEHWMASMVYGNLAHSYWFIILVVAAVIATIGLTFKSKDQ